MRCREGKRERKRKGGEGGRKWEGGEGEGERKEREKSNALLPYGRFLVDF